MTTNIQTFLAKIPDLQKQITEIQTKLESPEIWSDNQKASNLNQELAVLEKNLENLENLQETVENLEIAKELDEINDVENLTEKLEIIIKKLEQESYFQGKFDKNGAILSVYSGSGGVDAQDWAAMLASMYQTFCQNQNWSVKIIALSSGEDAGIKSITLEISGFLAYGYLKEEVGVHRLVRISPFNSGGTRETSFALVEVIPLGLETEIKDLVLDEKDLKWDYFMSSGKGGQSVNTTYSAVRLTHIPTKISVSCQNERSQLQNKQTAIKYLKNRLAVIELQKQKKYINDLKSGIISAEWGSQIRSYVLHPYKMVKDHRSNWETNNVDELLEYGKLEDIIFSLKKHNLSV
jgi:peptide chain release factor 2